MTSEATVMTLVKNGYETYALRKTEEDLLDVFQRNCQRNALGTRLTDHISNSWLYKKCGSILMSMAIMRKRLRSLGQILPMKMAYCRILSFSTNRLGPNEKQVVPEWGGRMS